MGNNGKSAPGRGGSAGLTKMPNPNDYRLPDIVPGGNQSFKQQGKPIKKLLQE